MAAFLHIPNEMRGAALGLLALPRNECGSVTSTAQTFLERCQQFHALRLNENAVVIHFLC
jgi:DHA2 family multidrug resistance protein